MAVDSQTGRKDLGGAETVIVNTFTNGTIGPTTQMLGPVRDGGHLVANTAPGCWGPMITPALRGGHEVSQPVSVQGAEPGDAIAIRIQEITVASAVSSSGVHRAVAGRFLDDPGVAARCANCGILYPPTRIQGVGETAVRCVNCGADATPYVFVHGYTVAFDGNRQVGVTLPRQAAEVIALDASRHAALPENSVQNSILVFAAHDFPGQMIRLRPFIGHLGTTPAVDMPASKNAGDAATSLVGAAHQYAITADQLRLRTDAHMDIDAVRAGAVLVCPVKVPGGGVYVGDMHALQGDGEIAGHTCDVSGVVTMQVHLLRGLDIDGPILFPLTENLPYLARPFSPEEQSRARTVAQTWGLSMIERTAPVSVVGTGINLNDAIDNGLSRAADLLRMTVPEVRNRATIMGAIEIGRAPGVVQVTFLAPLDRLAERGLLSFIWDQYGIS